MVTLQRLGEQGYIFLVVGFYFLGISMLKMTLHLKQIKDFNNIRMWMSAEYEDLFSV